MYSQVYVTQVKLSLKLTCIYASYMHCQQTVFQRILRSKMRKVFAFFHKLDVNIFAFSHFKNAKVRYEKVRKWQRLKCEKYFAICFAFQTLSFSHFRISHFRPALLIYRPISIFDKLNTSKSSMTYVTGRSDVVDILFRKTTIFTLQFHDINEPLTSSFTCLQTLFNQQSTRK